MPSALEKHTGHCTLCMFVRCSPHSSSPMQNSHYNEMQTHHKAYHPSERARTDSCCALVLQVTIWLGVFPIVVSWWAALGLTIYFIATNMVLYYIKSLKHIEALWFANCANQLLFYTYIKVCLCPSSCARCGTGLVVGITSSYVACHCPAIWGQCPSLPSPAPTCMHVVYALAATRSFWWPCMLKPLTF